MAILGLSLLAVAGCRQGPEPSDDGADPGTLSVTPARTVGELSPFQTRKAEALLRDRLPCLGCHVLDEEGGRIGPGLSDVGSRVTRAEIRRVIATPREARPGSVMPRIPMPERWRNLLVAYLAGRTGNQRRASDSGAVATPSSTVPRTGPDGVPDGRALYGRWCASCHGAEGGGDGPNARFLPQTPTAHADSAYMATRPDDVLFDAVWAGGRIMGRSHRMPPFGETLSRDEIRALVGYMRELCGCRGPDWSRDGRRAP